MLLAYFGRNNWGKLIEMSEGGMSIEFAQLPPVRQRISFIFQVMGRMPAPRVGEVLDDSFQAAGEVLWTQGFERIAGVRFVDLDETSREQVRRWVSYGRPGATLAPAQNVQQEVQGVPAEPRQPPAGYSKSSSEVDVVEAVAKLKTQVPIAAEPPSQPEPPLAAEVAAQVTKQLVPVAEPVSGPEFEIVVEEREAPSAGDFRVPAAAEQSEPEWGSEAKHPIARAVLVALTGCLAAMGVLVGAKMVLSRWVQGPQAVERGPVRATPSQPTGAEDPLFAGPAQPFQVEVQDANGKRWTLSLASSASRDDTNPLATESAASPGPSPRVSEARVLKGPAPTDAAKAERDSTLSATQAGQPGRSAGSDVQQAHLIKSVPPKYPAVAKAKHVGGDVVMEATIDAAGNVTSVKVISGPPELQQAAVQAVRQWKYEPARLDGRAVAMNLRVALKFHLN